ncbi:MAG: YncE family protein, partial [Methylocella sp.]
VVATVAVGVEPSDVAVTPDGKHAYVANPGDILGTVSVIDTASNTVVATVPMVVSIIAITPDGKHAYVGNGFDSTVLVIDTGTNTVVGSPIFTGDCVRGDEGSCPDGIAITPDGKHAYVTNGFFSTDVVVIDTATNMVVGPPIRVGLGPPAVAINPDGKHAYVTNPFDDNVSVIDTAINKVVATVAVGVEPSFVAVTPDGKHAYVANDGNDPGTVSVIATASNTVVATVTSGNGALSIAPDGKHVYAAAGSGVFVIATASNTVVATIPVPAGAVAAAIVPPPPGVPFLAFNARLAIQFGGTPNLDSFGLGSSFIMSSTAPAIDPLTQPVTLQVGSFATTIPIGSFVKQKDGSFTFKGVIDGVRLDALIKQTGTLRYAFFAQAGGATLTGTVNTVYATLIIGGDSGATSITAEISH